MTDQLLEKGMDTRPGGTQGRDREPVSTETRNLRMRIQKGDAILVEHRGKKYPTYAGQVIIKNRQKFVFVDFETPDERVRGEAHIEQIFAPSDERS